MRDLLARAPFAVQSGTGSGHTSKMRGWIVSVGALRTGKARCSDVGLPSVDAAGTSALTVQFPPEADVVENAL